ncbi:hypothetical protein QBC38DRAFT_542319 [Podospora fimiseda]|uniref:Uncharacterized protein n=1 Tax=Podospora fimiseda TaxID=252190 RepID=A0AAN7H339_9PEZI|nr:hypothetical protein QBC38DRAFT_542319 [Podospora fimiseda]
MDAVSGDAALSGPFPFQTSSFPPPNTASTSSAADARSQHGTSQTSYFPPPVTTSTSSADPPSVTHPYTHYFPRRQVSNGLPPQLITVVVIVSLAALFVVYICGHICGVDRLIKGFFQWLRGLFKKNNGSNNTGGNGGGGGNGEGDGGNGGGDGGGDGGNGGGDEGNGGRGGGTGGDRVFDIELRPLRGLSQGRTSMMSTAASSSNTGAASGGEGTGGDGVVELEPLSGPSQGRPYMMSTAASSSNTGAASGSGDGDNTPIPPTAATAGSSLKVASRSSRGRAHSLDESTWLMAAAASTAGPAYWKKAREDQAAWCKKAEQIEGQYIERIKAQELKDQAKQLEDQAKELEGKGKGKAL